MGTKLKKNLIKKGAPLPGSPGYKFEESFLSKPKAERKVHDLLEQPRTREVKTVRIPRQFAVYRRKFPKISR